MKKIIYCRLIALCKLSLLSMLSLTVVGQDLSDAQRQERCQNNKNRIAELETESASINKELYKENTYNIYTQRDKLAEVRKFKTARYITIEEEKKLNGLGAEYGWNYNDCLDIHDNSEGAQKICLAELEKKIVKIIDKDLSEKHARPKLLNRLQEIYTQIADHRRNLIALGCNQITNTGVTKKQPGDEISVGQDLTEGQKKDRCQNNKNRIAALERESTQIDVELSQTMEKKEIEDARDHMVYLKSLKYNSESLPDVLKIASRYNFNWDECLEIYEYPGEYPGDCLGQLGDKIAKKIDKAVSLQDKRPGLIKQKNELNNQMAWHRNNLIALGCDAIKDNEKTTNAPPKDNSSFDERLSGTWQRISGGAHHMGPLQLEIVNGVLSGGWKDGSYMTRITSASYDSKYKRLSITYLQEWSKTTGKADFDFNEDPTRYTLGGRWLHDDGSASGQLSMWRKK